MIEEVQNKGPMEPDQKSRIEEFRGEIQSLEDRDLQLWGIGLLVLMVVATGFVTLMLPNLSVSAKALQLDGRFLPQLIFGFITLIVLFNIYAIGQRRALRRTRKELIAQFLRGEAAEKLLVIDPLTEVFNRRYLESAVAKEVSRADRHGSTFTFLMIDVDDFKSVNTRFGHPVGDQILLEVARLLKTTFRPTDTVIRYGGDEFLVILSDANEQTAAAAKERLLTESERWNKSRIFEGYNMRLSCGLASYAKGASVAEILSVADQRMYQHKSGGLKKASNC